MQCNECQKLRDSKILSHLFLFCDAVNRTRPEKLNLQICFQQSVFRIDSRNCSPSTISVMIFETLADIWPPSLSILIFRRYIGMDLSDYPSDSSGHQTLRRRPPQRAKKKPKFSGKSLEWPKVKQTCLTPCQPSLPSGEHLGMALGWDALYTMHEVPSRTATKARSPQKKLTGRDSFG